MVNCQRKNLYNLWKKSEDCFLEEDGDSGLAFFGSFWGNFARMNNREKSKLLCLVFLLLASCCLVSAPMFLFSSSNFPSLYSSGAEKASSASANPLNKVACFSPLNGTLCCDRSSERSDICVMKGDVRTDATSPSSLILYTSHGFAGDTLETSVFRREKIRPYTRKWEKNVMKTIDELDLIVKPSAAIDHRCDVHHRVPAIFFSTGGYTGNLYHEFNDGILPLYITSQHMKKKVVFVILEYHSWWIAKYGDVLSQLSDFPVIDFRHNHLVHCFPEAIVGLRIHGELAIDPQLMYNHKTMVDFHDLLGRAYSPRIRHLVNKNEKAQMDSSKPKLVIVSRNNGSRSITNQEALIKTAADIGFNVVILKPTRTSELAKIYHIFNSSDVVVGVHGAALTHLMFMKPGSVFIQVIPLGTEWAADAYYGEPARKFGLKYIGYTILPGESSLSDVYGKKDPILVDPESVTSRGWEFTKKIYLDHQTVTLDLQRFGKRLLRAYDHCRRRTVEHAFIQ